MEIHFQTTDHVVAVEKVAEQHIGTKYFKCNSLRVISHIIIKPKPKNMKEHKNSLGQVIYPKMCNCSSFRENCVTHARTHARTYAHTWCKLYIIFRRLSQVGDNIAM